LKSERIALVPCSARLASVLHGHFMYRFSLVIKIYFNKKLAQVKKRITFAPALKEARSGRLWEMGKKVAEKSI
jgi:hypothetical protein